MKFLLKPTDPAKLDVDVMISFCWEEDLSKFTPFPSELSKDIKEAAVKEHFTGSVDQVLVISSHGLIGAYKLICVGLGDKGNFNIYNLYTSIARGVKKAQEIKAVKVAVNINNDLWMKKFTTNTVAQVIVEASTLSAYKFLKYKSEEEKKKERALEEVILSLPANKIAAAEEGIRVGKIVSEAVIFARDLINEPAEVTSPSYLSQIAEDLAKDSKGAVKVKILEKEEVEKFGMGAFLGVAAGSDKPPKFIRLSYRLTNPKKKIVLIGKGITFDTGGLSLKTPEFMETMKSDMSGAAGVLAVFKALSLLKPKVEVVGLIPACENMPGGRALKPGDILHAMNGKTIEVLNTDAEGRLTLADALSFALSREKPDEIIDIATLTGACIVALGQEIAGMWGNDDKLMTEIEDAAIVSGERIWRMPLAKDYKELLKSHIADIKNVQTGRFAGAIAAALFLSEFVGKTPWVHLDIAGPAYVEKDTPLTPQGGAGFGVRLLLNFLLNK